MTTTATSTSSSISAPVSERRLLINWSRRSQVLRWVSKNASTSTCAAYPAPIARLGETEPPRVDAMRTPPIVGLAERDAPCLIDRTNETVDHDVERAFITVPT